jgi:photosystem II stability/assembly factor-like uncharacterized protein
VKNAHRGVVICAVTLALGMALAGRTGSVIAANADEPAVSLPDHWDNVSEAFSKRIGVDAINPPYLRNCTGLIVTPTGDIFIQTATKGICVSQDQGATWSVVAGNNVTGRCENGFCFSIAYPYDGRMALFCYDAQTSGGITLDGGKTWKPFSKNHRGLQFADVDWSTPDPQTILGLTHEPYFTILSDDCGKSWRQIYQDQTPTYALGVIDGKTFTRFVPKKHGNFIELSTDAGQTWARVADYFVQGLRPVHYGRDIYWTTSQGVVMTTNGKDWTLTGNGAGGALYGPYFGASEQEFVVVTHKYFLKTEDGGKTWKPIAKFHVAPDIFHNAPGYCYFGWDAKHNILYASGLGGSVYRLKL